MKSMIIAYSLFVILSFSSAGKFNYFKSIHFIDSFLFILVLSHTNHKTRLYDIVRKTVSKDTDTIILEVRPHKSPLTTTILPTTEQQIQLHPRESWDSGEENYFKWAAFNRRPMESLAGRKRSIRKYTKIVE